MQHQLNSLLASLLSHLETVVPGTIEEVFSVANREAMLRFSNAPQTSPRFHNATDAAHVRAQQMQAEWQQMMAYQHNHPWTGMANYPQGMCPQTSPNAHWGNGMYGFAYPSGSAPGFNAPPGVMYGGCYTRPFNPVQMQGSKPAEYYASVKDTPVHRNRVYLDTEIPMLTGESLEHGVFTIHPTSIAFSPMYPLPDAAMEHVSNYRDAMLQFWKANAPYAHLLPIGALVEHTLKVLVNIDQYTFEIGQKHHVGISKLLTLKGEKLPVDGGGRAEVTTINSEGLWMVNYGDIEPLLHLYLGMTPVTMEYTKRMYNIAASVLPLDEVAEFKQNYATKPEQPKE